jgi:rod shape-determining protein MreD
VKLGLAFVLLGALTLMLQGVAASVLPTRFCPDLGFLLVIAVGLCWRSTTGGLLLAALLGYLTDLLSGSLLGQHMLLRIAAFVAARFASRHLNLRGPRPQAVFVAALTVANALGLVVLTAFFAPAVGLGPVALGDLLPHALVNALFAPGVAMVTQRLVSRLGDDPGAQRLLPLEPRKRPA